MIEFSDGVRFDTSGEFRVESAPDGFYVVGHGVLVPVDTREEGERLVWEMQDDPCMR